MWIDPDGDAGGSASVTFGVHVSAANVTGNSEVFVSSLDPEDCLRYS
jgi:hypothetical protein